MEKAINSNAVAYIEHLIDEKVHVVNMQVHNRWLVALLSSNVYFRVLNK